MANRSSVVMGPASLASTWTIRPDGNHLKDSPHRLVKTGKIASVPLMIGGMSPPNHVKSHLDAFDTHHDFYRKGSHLIYRYARRGHIFLAPSPARNLVRRSIQELLPKLAICFCTHSRATRWSSSPRFSNPASSISRDALNPKAFRRW